MRGMLAHNLNRDVREVRLFENGTIFTGSTSEVRELSSLSLGFTGSPRPSALHSVKDAGFFELKGAVESLLSLFAPSDGELSLSAANKTTLSADVPSWIERGRGASLLLDGREVARFGELAAAELHARKMRQVVCVAEIDLKVLYKLPLRRAAAREISRFQAVERDFSFSFPDHVHWKAIAEAIRALSIAELTRFEPVEIFRQGKSAAAAGGNYALLLRCIFQSAERTLREDELTGWSAKVMDALTTLGGTLRA